MPRLALGLDFSTQSLTASVVDISDRGRVCELSLDYLAEEELREFGIDGDYLLPPEEEGDARQPAAMFFAALELMLPRLGDELRASGLSLAHVAAINVSAQQHGHVLLRETADGLFSGLAADDPPRAPLADHLSGSLAVPWARIWRTSNTAEQSRTVRERVGGSRRIIEISGSDAPLRFSAFGIRKTAQDHPGAYAATRVIHQLGTLFPAALAGRLDTSLDWGNACGSSLMDYRARRWSDQLLEAVAEDLPDGADGLRARLPRLESARSAAGAVANYFVGRHGLSPDCIVGIGSGDNPQAKALLPGTLLSLGTSFVIMAATDGESFDERGYANAMYDALDRPFCFGCRTNGALRWDEVRAVHGLARREYGPAERALDSTPVGNRGRLFLWLREAESFPPSPPAGPLRVGYDEPDLAADYTGIVEGSLASVYSNSRHFIAPGEELYLTGGPSASQPVLRRVAAIWRRRAVAMEAGGAALGAAATAACLWLTSRGEDIDPGRYCAGFLQRLKSVEPREDDISAVHGEDGLLERCRREERKIAGG